MLSAQSLEKIQSRRERSRINANIALVKELAKAAKGMTPRADIHNALDLLVGYAQTIQTLGNDIDLLLEDRDVLKARLDVVEAFAAALDEL